MRVRFEDGLGEVITVMDHADRRFSEYFGQQDCHLVINEQSVLERITCWEMREFSGSIEGNVHLECNSRGILFFCIDPELDVLAIGVLERLASLVESKA